MKDNRIYYFDNLRAILIVLVVFGHLIEPLLDDSVYRDLYRFVYSFHMPLFAYVSGVFSKKISLKGIGNLVYKVIFYQILFAITFGLAIHFAGYQTAVESTLKISSPLQVVALILTPIWLLWYLVSLILWKLLLFVFGYDKRMIAVSFLIGVFAILIPIDGYVLSIQRTITLLPFFLMGFYTQKEDLLVFIQKRRRFLVILGLSLMVLLFANLFSVPDDYRLFYYSKNSTSLNISFITALYLRTLTYFFSLNLMLICILIIPHQNMFFTYIGQRTFPVYIYHTFLFILLSLVGFYKYIDGINSYLGIVIMMLISILSTYVLSNQKLVDLQNKNNISIFTKRRNHV